MRNLKQLSGATAILILLFCRGGYSAQLSEASAVRTARPSELAAAHAQKSSLLPSDARDAQFDDKQAVTVDGSPQLTVVPVRFKTPVANPAVEGQMLTHCAVVVKPQGGTPSLLVTLGAGNTEMMTCTDLRAVGGTPAVNAGDLPDLILIYDAYTGRESLSATILLTWDAKTGRYTVDEAASQWLGEQKNGGTVAGARRLLAKKRHP